MRQMLGWREYAVIYHILTPMDMCRKLIRRNFKNNKRILRRDVWFVKDYNKSILSDPETPEALRAILLPVWQTGYAHHIIRLYLLSVLVQLFVDPMEIYQWMLFVFADSLDFVMRFNVFAMGFFDRRFTRKQYIFSSQYIYTQSGGRIPKDERLDNLYRFFMDIYKDELVYAPTTKAPDP